MGFVDAWSLNDVLVKSPSLGYLVHLNLRIYKTNSISCPLAHEEGETTETEALYTSVSQGLHPNHSYVIPLVPLPRSPFGF